MRAILTYHSVDPSGSAISVNEAAFRAHVRWMATRPVKVCGLPELLRLGDDSDAVALTFDDAFVNFAEVAWPRLEELGWPVTLFVVSGRTGGTNAWGGRESPGIPTLPLLDWEALGRLAESGVTIGAHSRTHRDLSACPDTELQDELQLCAEEIETHLGRRPDTFAFPYGATSDRVTRAAAAIYQYLVTTELRPLRTGDRPDALPRLDAYYLRDAERLGAWGSGSFRRWIAFRGALRRARGVLNLTGSRT